MTLSIVQMLAALLWVAALVLGGIRFILGPTALDRVVSADTLSVVVTAGLIVLSLWLDSPLYLDVALVYSALAFAGVVAVARAVEKGAKN